MARPPEGKRQASFPGAAFFFAGAFRGAPHRPGGGARGRGAGGGVIRPGGGGPSLAHSRVITPMQPASSTAPKRSSIQKTHLLSTQRST